jgi:hypothetical protein
MRMKRPFAVTLLAILAGIAAVLAAFHMLQAFGILQIHFGPFSFRGFNLWYGLMWALMLWIWIWLVQMLWRMDPQGWLFLAAISTLNLIFITLEALGAGGNAFSDQSLDFIVSALILIYVLLPSTKAAFGIQSQKM